jgi:hypothetical protein
LRHLVEVEREGNELNAVFDISSRRSYIKSELVDGYTKVFTQPYEVKLGGEVNEVISLKVRLCYIKKGKLVKL